MTIESDEWSPPSDLEEYRIIRELGRGAMGRVFLAEDQLLERLVAIKFLAGAAPTEGMRKRFLTEAKAVARLAHPNVVAIHRVVDMDRLPFLVSEFVRGSSLADLEKPIPEAALLRIALDLARGLAAAHRCGVLHRDIKPANAMMSEDGTTKLLDFGLAELVRDRYQVIGDGDHLEISRPSEKSASRSQSDRVPAGTPLYMAPEVWWSQTPSTRADVYSLGMLLFELAAGEHPKANRSPSSLVHAVLNEDSPALHSVAPWLSEGFAVIIDRCVRRDASLRFADGDALCAALEQIAEPRRASSIRPTDNPYRGLLVFDAEHRHLFFGRRSEALAIIERLRGERLLIIAGDSGTGKSSLCRAGVLTLLAEGAIGSDALVESVSLGRRPMQAIADAVATLLSEDALAIASRLRSEPMGVARDLRRLRKIAVLFIDQLEELFTLSTRDEAAVAAETLHRLVESGSGIRLLVTIRSDFLTRVVGLPGLGDSVSAALYLLRPLSPERMREVVLGPAADRGFRFETSEMVDALVLDAQRSVGSLPLLQFALSVLWDERDTERRLIPQSALEKIGGVTGALARHADHVVAGLPHSERSAARAILLALVTDEGARAQRTHAELVETASRVSPTGAEALAALIRGRLIVAQECEHTGEAAYSIAHEALVRGWDTLRGWLNHDAERRALRHRLERAADDWDRLGRTREALWGERLLAEVRDVDELTLNARDAAFLRAARRVAARRRARSWVMAMGIPVALAVLVLGMFAMQRREREHTMLSAARRFAEAEGKERTLGELRRQAYAQFDAALADVAEKTWQQALLLEPEVDRAFAETGELLERLLRDDAERDDARALLGKVLCERARLAEQQGRHAQRDEMVRRLALYGIADQWSRPATLSIRTNPAGTNVTMQRYDLNEARWVESGKDVLGASPLADTSVVPGSILLIFAAAGRAEVRYPLLVERGQHLTIDIEVPPAAEIPSGFVYVPTGAFLYGTAGGEDARAFYLSRPIHTVSTRAYLVARYETTYGEWIEYLRTLPRDERARHMPNQRRQGFVVQLSEPRDGTFELTFGPEASPAVAKYGEPIRYVGRANHGTQNWLRMPVSGLSFNDQIEYGDWLDRTGRVHGARPCTEYEWERAARGADGRSFPASERLSPEDANFDLTYGRVATAFGPDEVGSHGGSVSPFGVHDMAGNVWEWTAFSDDPRIPIAKGGCFFQQDAIARIENRSPDLPNRRDAYYGIRMCASFPQP